MKHIRLFSLLLAVLMLTGCLAACGSQTTTPTPDLYAEDETPEDTSGSEAAGSEVAPTDSTTGTTDSTTGVASDPTQAPSNSKGPSNSKNPSSTKNTSTSKQPSKSFATYTTSGTTAEPTTAAPKNPLRVLSIGHSFSKDAMEKYLWDMLESSGKYDYIVIAYLFYPGCSLDRQWDHISGRQGVDANGSPYEYQQYRKTNPYTGEWETVYKPDGYKNLAEFAIKDEKWDVITLQPSPDYGAGPEKCQGQNDYADVGNILNWINAKKTNKQAKIMYHMTWAFANDCRLWSFRFSNNDQMTMYKDFVNATKKYIFNAHPGKVAGIIPAGTSIQNARSSKLGDVFNMPGNFDPNADGYHLNDRGDCVAALTWYCVLTGKKASTAACPKEWKADWKIFTEAVDAAIKKPYEVTQSSYK
ncbi:MAG: DUF4886 domain-containing protein [Ruminococcaceae bacterium]|nr:DUF4886 domain-containing protein [Oscillospiraceae bacterium]